MVLVGWLSCASISYTVYSAMVSGIHILHQIHTPYASRDTDMGLGKSLQTICIVASKHEERRKAYTASRSVESQPLPSLIVCPPTLVGHWFHEFKKFAPHLPVLRYAGNARERQTLRGSFSGNEIIITSYEVIRSEGDFLNSLDWLFCVLDEGHIIKNGKTKLSKAIKMLKANHRLILSGTPIQNNVLELWNLFDFLMPGFLGTEKQFSDRFSKPILANRSGKATPKEQEAGEPCDGALLRI